MNGAIHYNESTLEVFSTFTFTENTVSLPTPPSGALGAFVDEIPTGASWYSDPDCIAIPAKPSVSHIWDWPTKAWVFDEATSLAAAQATVVAALAQVDTWAGKARLRYITDAPGQPETYMKKEAQARAYVAAGYTGTVPSFIDAEATALSKTPTAVADDIITQADYWTNVKGPAIEAIRLLYKSNINGWAEGIDDASTRGSSLLGVTTSLTWAELELGAL
jgi:hypothetical protein